MHLLRSNEITVDNFAGGGGASTGIEHGLNRHVDIAINHDPEAIEMHKTNHPETKHYCESVWDVDPVEACAGRPVGLAWFSPDCKHFSIARGGTPVDKNIRGLAWVVLKWCSQVPVRVFMLENVQEFTSWGPLVEYVPGKFKPDPKMKGTIFDAFISILTTGLNKDHFVWDEIRACLGDDFPHYDKLANGLGYNVECKVLSACDYGTPTIRKRLFLVARNDGESINWPHPTHGPSSIDKMPYKSAGDVIDWSLPTKSIFGRKKPLAENTMKRIAKGINKFVINNPNPYLVSATETGVIDDFKSFSNSLLDPKLIDRHNIDVSSFITKYYTGVTGSPLHEPLSTVTAIDHNALVTSHIVKFRGTNAGHKTDDPLHTLSAGGTHMGEVRAFLIKYFNTNVGHSLNNPMHTITTKDRFALVTVHGQKYLLLDVRLRMLQPHELFKAQGFPDDYIIKKNYDGKVFTKTSQVAKCGNAVCPPVAMALVNANFSHICVSQDVAA